MKPSIGRIVHVVLFGDDSGIPSETYAGIITRVWSDTVVNVTVFPANVSPMVVTSATLDSKAGWSWSWPPRA